MAVSSTNLSNLGRIGLGGGVTSRTMTGFGPTGGYQSGPGTAAGTFGPIYSTTFGGSSGGGGGYSGGYAPAAAAQQPSFSGGGGYSSPYQRFTSTTGSFGGGPSITSPTVNWNAPAMGAVQAGGASGGSAQGFTSQAAAGPNINAMPIWNSQMMRQAGASTLAGSQAAARMAANQATQRAGAQGFGAASPAIAQRNAIMEALGTMGGTQEAGIQNRDMAEKNREAVLRGQLGQSQEARRRDEVSMDNARNQTQASIGTAQNQTGASIASANNATNAAIASQRGQLDAAQMGLDAALANAQMSLQGQLGQGQLGLGYTQANNSLLQSMNSGGNYYGQLSGGGSGGRPRTVHQASSPMPTATRVFRA